ncbi:hypothetical protein PENSPDRAFT_760010 [Peniophora sp. CONT]|nr:hypothetical protein PENSPDRAFT_760010 [Peniophora sp. CONT]
MSDRRPHARYVHNTSVSPTNQPKLYQLGQKQGALSLQRYHYLRAAITNSYGFKTVPPAFPGASERYDIHFQPYSDFPLEPIKNVKLRPGTDGTFHAADLELAEFWTMILSYNATFPLTTGWDKFDKLFKKLKENGYDKGSVNCMFFARESGCLDPRCPFRHDNAKAQRDREKVLKARRDALKQPSSRAIRGYQRREVDALLQRTGMTQNELLGMDGEGRFLDDDDGDGPLHPEHQKIIDDSLRLRAICEHPNCDNLMWKKDENANMAKCSKCKAAYYCSSICQRTDWKAHKPNCISYDDLVDNDDFWDEWGNRKDQRAVAQRQVSVRSMPFV